MVWIEHFLRWLSARSLDRSVAWSIGLSLRSLAGFGRLLGRSLAAVARLLGRSVFFRLTQARSD